MSKDLDDYKVISVPTTMAEIKRQQKEHEALEILRRGNFEFGDKHKFRITLNSGIILTKEEYDLLKEVLL